MMLKQEGEVVQSKTKRSSHWTMHTTYVAQDRVEEGQEVRRKRREEGGERTKAFMHVSLSVHSLIFCCYSK